MSDMAEENRNQGQWFVIHTLSGHENKVRDKIQRQMQISDEIPVHEVYIPTEKVVEVRNGKKTPYTRKFFPGYILVRMDLYDDEGVINEKAWYFIRNGQGVLGFLGGGNKPVPLSESEVNDMRLQSKEASNDVKPKVSFAVGETVRINGGAFEGLEGVINGIDYERGRLMLMVSIFGRSTPVEVEFGQVDRNV